MKKAGSPETLQQNGLYRTPEKRRAPWGKPLGHNPRHWDTDELCAYLRGGFGREQLQGNNARYVWKRIPPAIRSANAELAAIWCVGQRIWQKDFPGIYTAIGGHPWSENIQLIMDALREATRQRAFGLVSQAYTSISADDFAAFVGLPVEDAVKGVLEQGWQADSATRMVMPKKPESAPVALIPNEQQLARLTDYVAFLEN